MRFLVRYPSGAEHEVELQGTVVVAGRDPACDLVLNDAKCSRRHAVLEAGPQGIAIRDSGSANGVLVNGRRVERAALTDGDIVQLGDVSLKVLSDDIPETVVMDDEEQAGSPSGPAAPGSSRARDAPAAAPRAAAPRPPIPPPDARPSVRTEPIPRPMTLTLLSALWLMAAVFGGLGGLTLAAVWHRGGQGLAWLPAVVGMALVGVCSLVAVGLWVRSPWARLLQIVCAAFGLLSCVFFPACLAILIYLLRPELRIQFRSRGQFRGLPARDADTVMDDASDLTFTGAILGSLLLGAVLVLAAAFLARGALGSRFY